MRPIEFRAWDKINNRWLPQDFLWIDAFGVTHEDEGYGAPSELKSENYYLMQFTGLLDKNGNKIFEGDILKFENFGIKIGVVMFGEYDDDEQYTTKKHLGWHVQCRQECHGYSSDSCHSLIDLEDAEVIGNKYENKGIINLGEKNDL